MRHGASSPASGSSQTDVAPDVATQRSTSRRDRVRAAIRPSWSNRNLDLLLLARAVMSVNRALAGVLVPIYLALEGFSALELSEYVVVVALTSAILSAVIGTLSDRIGRRPFLIVVPLVAALSGLAFAFFSSIAILFVMGAAGGFGRGSGAGAGNVGPYQPAESALITDSLDARHRSAAFGRLGFVSSLGGLIGGLLAILVPSVHLHGAAATAAFRDGFLATAVTAVVAGALALGVVDVRTPERKPAAGRAGRARSRFRVPKLPQKSRWLLYRLWITNSFNGVAVGMFGPFVTYWFFRRFGAGSGQIGILFAVINAATMASSLSAAGLARRWGLVRTVTVVRIAQAVLLVPMVLAPSFLAAGAVYLVRMVVQRVGLPLRQSYSVGLAHPDERGSVAALSNLPSQLVQSGSPLVTGYLMDEVSLNLPFDIAALFQLLNAASFWVLFHRHPPEDERGPAQATGAASGTHSAARRNEPGNVGRPGGTMT